MAIILLLLSLFVLSGCSSHADQRLEAIEAIIQQEPAQALAMIDTLDAASLKSAKDKALHSLLLSMALDKNYIDLQSDSLLRPALLYYSKHGSKYHRFLTFYYAGRIEENAERYDNALETYIKSEAFIDDKTQKEYVARVYTAKSRIHANQFAHDRALEECLKAAEVSKDLSNPYFYLRHALDIAIIKFRQGKYEESDQDLDRLMVWIEDKGLPVPSSFYDTKLRILNYTPSASKPEIEEMFRLYREACQSEGTPPSTLLCAEILNNLGRHTEALDYINSIDIGQITATNQIIHYYAVISSVYEGCGNYKKALEYRNDYEVVVEKAMIAVFNNDVRFLQERHENAIAGEKARREKALIITAAILLSIALITVSIRLVIRKRHYKKAVAGVSQEYDFIRGLVNRENGSEPEKNDILKARLSALKPYLEGSGIGRKRPSNASVAKLAEDRTKMLESLGLMCALVHPKFARLLADSGLDAEEIGLCSLYVSDYRPKELPDILGKGSIYHRNTEIRAKLSDLVKDTTLPVWLRKQYELLA